MTIQKAERRLQFGSSDRGAPSIRYPTDAARAHGSSVRIEEIEDAIARARRDGHDLAIAVLTAQPEARNPLPGLDYWARERPMSGDLAFAAALAVGEVLRGDDVVCYQPKRNRLVIALPLADLDGARAALGRAGGHLSSGWLLQMRSGAAQLMRDAATLDWLIAVATTRIAAPGQDPQPESTRADRSGERRRAPHRVSAAKGGTHGDAA